MNSDFWESSFSQSICHFCPHKRQAIKKINVNKQKCLAFKIITLLMKIPQNCINTNHFVIENRGILGPKNIPWKCCLVLYKRNSSWSSIRTFKWRTMHHWCSRACITHSKRDIFLFILYFSRHTYSANRKFTSPSKGPFTYYVTQLGWVGISKSVTIANSSIASH